MAPRSNLDNEAADAMAPATPANRSTRLRLLNTPPSVATPRPRTTRLRLLNTPTPVAPGLLTPPATVSSKAKITFKGKTIRNVPAAPRWSSMTESGGGIELAPAQPSLSVASATVVASMSVDPFEVLPIEIKQQIASLLDSDSDLVHFVKSCKTVNHAIEQDGCSFWRRRFLAKFEQPRNPGATRWKNLEYKRAYQDRRMTFKNGALFRNGKTSDEADCVRILRDLIMDSFSQHKNFTNNYPHLVYEDMNIALIEQFCRDENILRCLFDPRNAPKRRAVGQQAFSEPALQTIQTVLAPIALTDVNAEQFDFPTSQIAAYAPNIEQPIFKGSYGLTIDMEWALHQVNFWKFQFTREEESDIFIDIEALERSECPQMWNSQLTQESSTSFGKNWKGVSAFLNPGKDMQTIRDEDYDGDLQDYFSGADSGGVIQDFTFKLGSETAEESLKHFIYNLDLHRPAKRVQTRSSRSDAEDNGPDKKKLFRMEHTGENVSKGRWVSDGVLEPLPTQNGIPGWQRFTMMKYWMNPDDSINWATTWAHEGVMLPGGRIVVGRWWSPDDEAVTESQYSGPFILWNTN